MDAWLADVRAHVVQAAPDLLWLFEIYAGEARFGRHLVAADLARLPPGTAVLEVGAGAMLLSCQLVREGFMVTALEPTGSGFSHFDQLRARVLERAGALGCMPRVLHQPVESLDAPSSFAYAFSINVMEHVGQVALALERVGASLQPGAQYRFTCPNYLFPYEPHFNLPTLFSKPLTAWLLRSRILGSTRMPDPAGTWQSLNWINVPQIRRAVRHLPGLSVVFDRDLLVSTLERMVSDASFAERRSPLLRVALGWLVRTRLHRLFGLVPAVVQPVIDCRLLRATATGGAWPR
jgi:hypothetical protein